MKKFCLKVLAAAFIAAFTIAPISGCFSINSKNSNDGKLSVKKLLGNYFSSGLAAVQETARGKWGYIDNKGKFKIDAKYNEAFFFIGGLTLVKNTDGKMGFINTKGEEVIECKYAQIQTPLGF